MNRPRPLRLLVMGGLLSLASAPRSATATPNTEDDVDLALEYQAPAGCDDRAAFLRAVRARLHDARRARRKLSVTITRTRAYQGKLVSEDDRGHVPTREVSAPTCREVVDALALAAAIALEPEDDDDAPEAPRDATPIGASPPAPPMVPPAPLEPKPPRTLDDVAAAAGAGLVGTAGYAPVVTGGVGLFAEAQSRYGAFRLGGVFAMSDPQDRGASAGKVTFLFGAARADVCPRGVDRAAFTMTACARAEFGSLQAHVFGASGNADDTHAWLGAGLALRLRYLTGSALFIELEPDLVVPLLRPAYVLPPGVTVQQAGPVAGGATLWAGVLFWR